MKSSTKNYMPYLLALTAVLITVTGILFKQSFLRILPLYISLFVSFLTSRVSRNAFLLGGLNSILYAVVYFQFKLYASALYALLFSFTVQLATYLRWKHKPVGNATVFRAMTRLQRLLLALGFALVWGIVFGLLSAVGSGYRVFDVTTSLLGILNSFLTMFAFIEYVPLTMCGSLINIGLYLSMMHDEPAQITYLIYALYAVVCQLSALRKVLHLYKEQK